MWSDEPSILMYIASKLDSITDSFTTSTIKIAQEVDVSQQTVSRKLAQLEENGLIKRELTGSGVRLTFTARAITLLKRQRQMLDAFFEKKRSVKGVVSSGLGEGKYYMALEGYVSQFTERIGYIPYPGTLNIKVEYHELEPLLENKIMIDGFTSKERTFGGLVAYPLKVNGKSCHVIFPERSSHKDTAEIISPTNLRKELELKDGNEVQLE